MSDELYGIVLAGGKSSRMGTNKALLEFHQKPQALIAYELVSKHTSKAYLSCQPDQFKHTICEDLPQLHDRPPAKGPLGGLARAFAEHPHVSWLLVACDLPLLDSCSLHQLISARDPSKMATSFRSSSDGLPEPMCTIYEPSIRPTLQQRLDQKKYCARYMLMDLEDQVKYLDLDQPDALENANTPEDADRIRKHLT